MQYNNLGTSDLKVSKICLGTMTRGYQNTQQDAKNQLDYAVDQGINFIDTAEIYAIPPREKTSGLTEKYIGNRLVESGKRDDLVIATKVAGSSQHAKWIRNGEGFSGQHILNAIEGSLDRLQTDYVDLYQLHRPERAVPVWGKLFYDDVMRDQQNEHEERIEEMLTVLQDIQKSGKVRYFGLSNETPRGTMKFLQIAEKKGLPRMVSIQNAYSLLRREFDVGLAEVCLQEDIGLLAYSPLAGGMLTGKYQGGAEPANARYSTRGRTRMPYYTRERCVEAVDEIISIAQKEGVTPTELALARVNERVFVASNIIGATSMSQLKENIGSAKISLSSDAKDALDDLSRRNSNPACW